MIYFQVKINITHQMTASIGTIEVYVNKNNCYRQTCVLQNANGGRYKQLNFCFSLKLYASSKIFTDMVEEWM